MRLLFAGLLLVGCASDGVDWACADDAWEPGACEAGVEAFVEATSQAHVDYEDALSYGVHPPSSGDHRPDWAKWGEYEHLPPEHWVHNLEHGGVALLFHPCADVATVDALRDFAQARPDDDGGAFRYILTPYPDLPTAVAVVAWEWTWSAECVDPDAIDAFVDDHYRQAPEDVASDGRIDDLWIGR